MSIRSQLIGAAVCVALGAVAAWTIQEWRHDAEYARLGAVHASLLEQQAQAVVASVQVARELEGRRVAAVEEQRDIAIEQNAALAVDVAAGRDVSDRLRQQLDALRARAGGGDTATTERSSGQPDIDPIGMLIDMYAGLDKAGREVSEYADRLKITGLACEIAYDAVRELSNDALEMGYTLKSMDHY